MLSDIPNYEPPNHILWTGREDSLPGERFFQRVQCVDIRSHSIARTKHPVILGYCCDEGIRRNEGRVGAKTGPYELRQQLAKLAYHGDKQLLDIGNIICEGDALEKAQEQFSKVVNYCHKHKLKTVAFGGGHDIAWPHFRGLIEHHPKIGIINFDAHFDLRPLKNHTLATSGTPFWQIKDFCHHNHLRFDYCCLGIQTTANTKHLFKRALDWNVQYLTASQFTDKSYDWQTSFLDDFMSQHEHIYLSICLDVFAESCAPGVSAPQPLGIIPSHALPLLKYIVQTGKVVGMDIAELSPPLDPSQKTSRLAAAIIAELLQTQGM